MVEITEENSDTDHDSGSQNGRIVTAIPGEEQVVRKKNVYRETPRKRHMRPVSVTMTFGQYHRRKRVVARDRSR